MGGATPAPQPAPAEGREGGGGAPERGLAVAPPPPPRAEDENGDRRSGMMLRIERVRHMPERRSPTTWYRERRP